jgi:pilus assembly protein Flp/PilA
MKTMVWLFSYHFHHLYHWIIEDKLGSLSPALPGCARINRPFFQTLLQSIKQKIVYIINIETNSGWKEVRKMLFAPKEKGQGLVEYALILVLVAVVVIVILALLGPAIGKIFSNIVSTL